jgi:hypothetical protein
MLEHRGSRSLAIFAGAFVALGLSIGAWSVSTPLGAAPDEPSHFIAAASAVRGQFGVPEIELKLYGLSAGLIGLVRVPKWVANVTTQPTCFLHRPSVPAGCSPKVGSDSRMVYAATQFAHYPPLYYLIVGVPTLLSVGSGALLAMQFTGALIDAALIALGLFMLARYHPRRLPFLGALVALSPMVLFMSAVVNSNGMEIAAAFAAWCGGLCVVERAEVPRSLTVLTSASFAFLIVSRPLSTVNAAVIIAVLATLAGWDRSCELLRQRNIRYIGICSAIAALLTGLFLVAFGFPSLLGLPHKPRLTILGAVWLTLRLTGDRLRQSVGDFGWLDTPAPIVVVVVWALVLTGLVVYGMVVSPRARRALPLLAAAILAMPVVFESPQINTVGAYWEGRYWLPLLVGLPLVASSIRPRDIGNSSRSTPDRWLRLAGFVSVGALLSVCQFAAFLTALRRYETGLWAKPGTIVKWTPPGGTTLVICMFVAGQILLVGFLAWEYNADRRHEPDGDRSNFAGTLLTSSEQR